MGDSRVSDDMIRTVLLLPDESDEAARRRLRRPQRVHGEIVGGSAGLQQALARSPVRRSLGGSPGVRQRQRKWVVEFRFRASNWRRSQRNWIGTFDRAEEAMFAYDAAQYFLGKPTYYFEYPEGFFELCPPRFKNTPRRKDFVDFVREKAKQYAMHYRELQPNVLISEARTLTNRLLVLAGDGEEAADTSDIQVSVVTSAAADGGRPRGPAALEVTTLSLSADSELISDAAVEVTQLDGGNWSDDDGLPPLDDLNLYLCSQDDISKMDLMEILSDTFKYN